MTSTLPQRRDLFEPVVPVDKRHPAFEALRSTSFSAGSRALLNDLAQRMGDPDGNLVEQFQSQGFHARLFELACFAYLDTQGLHVDRREARPDFLVVNGERHIALEAVTAHSVEGQMKDISLSALREESNDLIEDKCNNEFPIRLGRALSKKLQKKYWNLPHCKDFPLVLVVGPFHEAGSTTYIDLSLARYLYGMVQFSEWVEHDGLLTRQVPLRRHEFGGKVIESNFFGYPDAENISAILYCNQWTVPRVFRMAAQRDGWSPQHVGTREGVALRPGFSEPTPFVHVLGDAETYQEEWWEGATLFHNPNAIHPLTDSDLRCTSAFRFIDGRVERLLFDFHPLATWMHVNVGKQP